MADNGKIIRNGAEIQIDENGNVVARPADGQEFIVEDDAVVGSLEAATATINGWPEQDPRQVDPFDATNGGDATATIEATDTGDIYILEITRFDDRGSGDPLELTIEGVDDGEYDYLEINMSTGDFTPVDGANSYELFTSSAPSSDGLGRFAIQVGPNDFLSITKVNGGVSRNTTPADSCLEHNTSGVRNQNPPFELRLSCDEPDSTIRGALIRFQNRGEI